MSEFSVKPGALRTYAHLLGEYGGSGINLADLHNTKVPGYVSEYVQINTSDGISNLFEVILSSNKTLVSSLKSTYLEAWAMFRISAINVDSSADVYMKTDQAESERMDKVWTGLGSTPVDDSPTGGTVSDPTTTLNAAPSGDVLIPDPVHWVMDQSGWLSIGNDILKVASVFGFDPAGDLTKAVLGDYSLVARAGAACTGLAACDRATAATVRTGMGNMTSTWTGHAANAATAYFEQVADAFEAHAGQLDEVADKYQLLAQACAEVATLLSTLLSQVIDKLIICASALAAAGCLQAVPGVDVIADIIGAYEVFVTAKSIKTFVTACTTVTSIVEGILLLTTGIAGACKPGSADTTFPVGAYSNGAQG